MATSAAESRSQTESLFAENNEPFFNTIGQKLTSHDVGRMSALPPIADI
jgi:hypothetical protein